MALLASERSTCLRKKVGCVVAKEGRVLTLGYAGAPSGLPHCLDHGCIIGPTGGCIRTAHAEQNAISWAAREGIALLDSTLYVTLSPCLQCANLIINSGIKKVVYLEEYRDRAGIEQLARGGIILVHRPDVSAL